MKETEGDEELIKSLSGAEDEIGYVMETDGRALKGIQIGISKNGASLEGAELIYRVYRLEDDFSFEEELPLEMTSEGRELILEKSYGLGTCLDGQYPYLPFDEEGLCTGKLYITFTYRVNSNTEGVMPGIFMNHGRVDKAATYINGEQITDMINGEDAAEMIKNYYIYSHNTYPLLYDSRVLTFVFLAASATVCYPHKKRREEEKDAAG
ncbi:MAG: hypothetical protein J6K58_09685 [Lachnospiraceae bacterium]|nr:hypothetical protein [Lachnospiraceae bacterium]